MSKLPVRNYGSETESYKSFKAGLNTVFSVFTYGFKKVIPFGDEQLKRDFRNLPMRIGYWLLKTLEEF